MSKFKRFAPAVIILILMAFFFFSGFYKHTSFELVRQHYVETEDLVAYNPVMAPLVYVGIYAFSTALSLPGAIFLSILGGFLFPLPWSTLYVVVGATLGATCLFLAARSALGNSLRKKASPWARKMEAGFKENAVSYLLFLRLAPIFPFWLVNLAPALFKIRLWTYVWTTFVGIIPGAFVFTQAGRGLGAIFETQAELNLDAIFNRDVKIALILLALFAITPLAIKKWRAHKRDRQ
jgi:uncharacterized membrane protein YdjX (TVP38/TMEM64 family)